VFKKKKFNDHPFAYHAEIELEIATLTNLGSGLGRVALPEAQLKTQNAKLETAPPTGGGWVVMVPFTLPGERVRARVFRNHKNFSEADLVTVLTPSPHRVAPRCSLYARCGGCQYQHLAYAEQLAWKRRQVAELLEHMAGITFEVAPVIGSPREFGYRSKITPHFNAPKPSTLDSPPSTASPIGFLRQGTRFDIVDVPRCEIATDAINEKLPEVRSRARARIAAGESQRGATLLLRHAQEGVTTDYDAIITEEINVAGVADPGPGSASAPGSATPATASDSRLGGARPPLRLRFLARDFFQNNPFILPAFTGYVRAQAAGSGARFLVDAYCGSGLFALACAPAFERVAGVEVSESSVRFARANAAANGLANATFLAADAAAIFAGLDFPPADTAVIIDPPRKGCDESFLAQLFAFAPRTVVYVSCDPATQMRDLKGFLAAGYALTAVQPFDLFPQTRHLECVITLRR
jgi:23S rRNA (uracil1939-C5)-methyltransferase/tRNA (uracil-5-)-methyltransferase